MFGTIESFAWGFDSEKVRSRLRRAGRYSGDTVESLGQGVISSQFTRWLDKSMVSLLPS